MGELEICSCPNLIGITTWPEISIELEAGQPHNVSFGLKLGQPIIKELEEEISRRRRGARGGGKEESSSSASLFELEAGRGARGGDLEDIVKGYSLNCTDKLCCEFNRKLKPLNRTSVRLYFL